MKLSFSGAQYLETVPKLQANFATKSLSGPCQGPTIPLQSAWHKARCSDITSSAACRERWRGKNMGGTPRLKLDARQKRKNIKKHPGTHALCVTSTRKQNSQGSCQGCLPGTAQCSAAMPCHPSFVICGSKQNPASHLSAPSARAAEWRENRAAHAPSMAHEDRRQNGSRVSWSCSCSASGTAPFSQYGVLSWMPPTLSSDSGPCKTCRDSPWDWCTQSSQPPLPLQLSLSSATQPRRVLNLGAEVSSYPREHDL